MIPGRKIADDILELLSSWEAVLMELSPALQSGPRNSQGRSVRQILGHMVDSASNNTHRIIHLQYQESPIHFPDYANLGNNERWIAIQHFQEEDWSLLLALWTSVHRHLAHILLHVDQGKAEQYWVSALGEAISLKDMIIDFPRHMQLHLEEIRELLSSKDGILHQHS